MARSPLNAVQCGVAGEYFVAAELSRRGYVASLTLRNTRGIDVLASNADATKSVAIQVKSHYGKTKEWMLSVKVEHQDVADNLFFVFVRLNDGETPSYHVVPASIVVRAVTESHKKWLETPGRNGQPHNDSPMRKFRDAGNEYLDRWDLLNLD